MTVTKKWRTLTRLWRQGGGAAIVRALLRKVFPYGNRVADYNRHLIVCWDRGSDSAACASVHQLSESERDVLTGENGQSSASVAAAVRRQEQCWAAFEQGELAAYVWIGPRMGSLASDTGFEIPHSVQSSTYWWRDVFVVPARRGQRYPQRLLHTWLRSLAATEMPVVWAEIDVNNTVSLRVHQHLGFEVMGELMAFCVLGLRVYRYRRPHSVQWTWRFSTRSFYQ